MNDNIGKVIKQIHYTFENLFNKEMEKYEITHSQMEILLYLMFNQNKEINQKNIEEKFNLTNPTVTGLLNRLENKEFIKRTISKKDARFKTITVTEKALKLCNAIHDEAENIKSKITYNVTDEEIEIANKVLEKILVNIKNIQERKNVND